MDMYVLARKYGFSPMRFWSVNAKWMIDIVDFRLGEFMEAILELILTILFKPFESKYDDTFGRIKDIRNKGLRIFLRILLVLLPITFIFGLCYFCCYLFRGN